MDYLASVPTIKKVRVYAGDALLSEADVDVGGYVGDLFKQVMKDYEYIYVKSEKALEYNPVPEHRLDGCDWLSSVLLDLDLLKQDVIEIHAAVPPFRVLRIWGGADAKHTNDEYWQHEETKVNMNQKFGEVLGPVFATYNYVQIKTPVGHAQTHIRLSKETYVKDVIAELRLFTGVIVIHAFNIGDHQTNANMRQLRIHSGADDEPREVQVDVTKTCGEQLGEVFAQYNYVCVKHFVPFGVLEHRVKEQTTLETVIEPLGLYEGVIEVYAKNV